MFLVCIKERKNSLFDWFHEFRNVDSITCVNFLKIEERYEKYLKITIFIFTSSYFE